MTTRKRRTPTTPQVEHIAEQRVTILAQQVGMIRNHFFALVQRHAATKVEAQQLSWDQGAELINGEMGRLDAALNQVEAI